VFVVGEAGPEVEKTLFNLSKLRDTIDGSGWPGLAFGLIGRGCGFSVAVPPTTRTFEPVP
jgi:hypothetical protein